MEAIGIEQAVVKDAFEEPLKPEAQMSFARPKSIQHHTSDQYNEQARRRPWAA